MKYPIPQNYHMELTQRNLRRAHKAHKKGKPFRPKTRVGKFLYRIWGRGVTLILGETPDFGDYAASVIEEERYKDWCQWILEKHSPTIH